MDHRKSYFIQCLTTLLILFLITAAAAQEEMNNVSLEAACSGSQIEITIELDVQYDLPEGWVGWVVERVPVGICLPTEAICPVTDFPVGAATYTLYDTPDLPDYQHNYRIKGVDADGGRHYMSLPQWPPGWYSHDYIGCGTAPAGRGTISSEPGWTISVVNCPDMCWIESWFLSGDTWILDDLVDTGIVVDLYGTIDANFEGPYIIVESFEIVDDCNAVAADETTWGAVKSMYR